MNKQRQAIWITAGYVALFLIVIVEVLSGVQSGKYVIPFM